MGEGRGEGGGGVGRRDDKGGIRGEGGGRRQREGLGGR